MRHSVTISFSTKNKNGIILKLTFSPPNMNQSALCTVGAFDISRLDSVFVYCWNTKRFAVIKADENYWVVLAITHMFEVGCIVEVSDVDARSRG